MDIKKETESKIHEFVRELLRTEVDLTVSNPTLDRNNGGRIFYIADAKFLQDGKFIKIYKKLEVGYKIYWRPENNKYILYGLECHWEFWDGGSNGHGFPFGQYEFDLEGNLLTQGQYKPFSSLVPGEIFTYREIEYRKIDPEMHGNTNEVRYNCIALNGASSGTKFKVSDFTLVLVQDATPGSRNSTGDC